MVSSSSSSPSSSSSSSQFTIDPSQAVSVPLVAVLLNKCVQRDLPSPSASSNHRWLDDPPFVPLLCAETLGGTLLGVAMLVVRT